MSPEYSSWISLEGKLGRYHAYSLDPPTRRPVRFPKLPRRRKGRVEDRPVDPQRVEVQGRVENCYDNPRRILVPAPMGCLLRLNLTEEILLDRMEEQLRLRRGGQDKVHQPLGEEPLITKIRTSQLLVGWMTPTFSRFDRKGNPDQYLIEYSILIAPNGSDDQLARIFKQSLKGQALLWYVRLRRNSINFFETLAQEFFRQYAYNRIWPKRIDALFDLKIGPKESLKDFVTRFREEASKVIEADRNEKDDLCSVQEYLARGAFDESGLNLES